MDEDTQKDTTEVPAGARALHTKDGTRILVDDNELGRWVEDTFLFTIVGTKRQDGSSYGYVMARQRKSPSKVYTTLARHILGPAPRNLVVLYRNGDPADLRLANLAYQTIAEMRDGPRGRLSASGKSNTGYRGVSVNSHYKEERYTATLRGVQLGVYDTAEEAARVYDEAAFAHYGAKAILNFPDEYVSSE